MTSEVPPLVLVESMNVCSHLAADVSGTFVPADAAKNGQNQLPRLILGVKFSEGLVGRR
ncbi:MAG: hypothetical protein ACREEE_00910 [Dongiaceae bacterium]